MSSSVLPSSPSFFLLPTSFRPKHPSAIPTGSCNLGAALKPSVRRQWALLAVSEPGTQDYSLGLTKNGPQSITERTKKITEPSNDDPALEDQRHMIDEVKRMFGSMGDGEITISAYDTAWVALVPHLNGNDGPQFPSSLQWIIDNQLPDGSWGDSEIFSAHDRLINTLACVIALKSWSTCPEKCEKGLVYLRENMWRLGEEDEELMSIGFEVAFPSLIDIAKTLELEFPYDDPVLQDIYAKRDLKMKKIPKEVMHEVPTTLLHSLEGMHDLDWSRLLKLQSKDGSFLFSPSATAYALAQTKDDKCFKYLQRAVDKFNGGVPNVYPVDLFEHIWVVDRLERLGISRYFEPEIKECLDYVHRYWDANGICWARSSSVQDVDDTAMGFRLLRLHGYDVSPDVLRNFEKDGEFFCFVGQSNQAITGIYNLNRASQVMFPGESLLERANAFSCRFLREKQASNQLLDKWIITKDLPGEVAYTLDFPFYASLPRVEARSFLDQYGGRNDTWIGKTLYRMPFVNNDLYLELAKEDFNRCQTVHHTEWLQIQKWYFECGLESHGVDLKSVLKDYFLAASSIFEPERAAERVGWAKTAVLAKAVASYFGSETCSKQSKENFISEFGNSSIRFGGKKTEGLVGCILQLLDDLVPCDGSQHSQEHEEQTHMCLRLSWEQWISNKHESGVDETGLLLARTVELCGGRTDPLAIPNYDRLVNLASSICVQLGKLKQFPEGAQDGNNSIIDDAIDSEMREMVKCVLKSPGGLSDQTNRTILSVVRSYYYASRCSSATFDRHITKVLFERVA